MTTKSTDSGRRSFFLKLGAGASAALASTAGLARTDGTDDAAQLAAMLQDEKALRKLHQSFESAIDEGRYDDVVELFAEDAEVVFSGDSYSHRSGVSQLFREMFRAAGTGKRMEQAPGFELDAEQRQERVEVSASRLSATASFPFSIQVGAPIETVSSLASMARAQGEGVQRWWEGGVYRLSYQRDAAEGQWQISRLEYETLSRADYRPGRTYARAFRRG